MTNDTPTPESTTPSTAGSPAALESDATGATENLGGTAATSTATLPPSAATATLPPVGPETAPATSAASVPTYPAYQAPGAPQQPAAPTPQPAQLYPPQRKTNILGVVTLVLGILGFGVIPVVTGHIALSQIKKSGEDGRGLTLAGLILGYVTVAGWLLVVAFWVALAGFAFVGAAYNSF